MLTSSDRLDASVPIGLARLGYADGVLCRWLVRGGMRRLSVQRSTVAPGILHALAPVPSLFERTSYFESIAALPHRAYRHDLRAMTSAMKGGMPINTSVAKLGEIDRAMRSDRRRVGGPLIVRRKVSRRCRAAALVLLVLGIGACTMLPLVSRSSAGVQDLEDQERPSLTITTDQEFAASSYVHARLSPDNP